MHRCAPKLSPSPAITADEHELLNLAEVEASSLVILLPVCSSNGPLALHPHRTLAITPPSPSFPPSVQHLPREVPSLV